MTIVSANIDMKFHCVATEAVVQMNVYFGFTASSTVTATEETTLAALRRISEYGIGRVPDTMTQCLPPETFEEVESLATNREKLAAILIRVLPVIKSRTDCKGPPASEYVQNAAVKEVSSILELNVGVNDEHKPIWERFIEGIGNTLCAAMKEAVLAECKDSSNFFCKVKPHITGMEGNIVTDLFEAGLQRLFRCCYFSFFVFVCGSFHYFP